MNWIQTLKNRIITWKIQLTKEPNWVNVCQSLDEYSIRIQKLQLEDEGIQCVIFDQRDSSYNAFGYLYLQVQSKDLERAKEIIESSNE